LTVKPFDEMSADELRAEAERRNAARAADPGAARGMPSRALDDDIAQQVSERTRNPVSKLVACGNPVPSRALEDVVVMPQREPVEWKFDRAVERAANESRAFLGIAEAQADVEKDRLRTGRGRRIAGVNGEPMVHSEHEEQVELFRWLGEMSLGRYPTFRKSYAIPNFSGRLGKATIRHSAALTAEGRKAGMLDVCYPVARGPYHALYIELKRTRGGQLRDDQLDWMIELAEEGHKVVRCKGAEAAKEAFLRYESLGKFGSAPKQEERHMLR
jgi:hypothetical protein